MEQELGGNCGTVTGWYYTEERGALLEECFNVFYLHNSRAVKIHFLGSISRQPVSVCFKAGFTSKYTSVRISSIKVMRYTSQADNSMFNVSTFVGLKCLINKLVSCFSFSTDYGLIIKRIRLPALKCYLICNQSYGTSQADLIMLLQ